MFAENVLLNVFASQDVDEFVSYNSILVAHKKIINKSNISRLKS